MRFWRIAVILWVLSLLLGALCRYVLRESSHQLFEHARQSAAANQSGQAESRLRRLLARQPDRTDARLLLAKLAYDRKDWATVAAAFQGVPDSDPMAGSVRVAEGDAWIKLNQAVLAEDRWTRAYHMSPEDPQPRLRLIYLYGLQLRREPWMKLLWELYDRDQVALREMVQLMIAQDVVWESEEAIQDVGSFAAANADDTHSRRAGAQYLLLAGQIPEAIRELNSILQSNPHDAETWLALVECHLARADYESARNCLDQMSELPLDEPRLWKHRGSLAVLEHRLGDSVTEFAKAMVKTPYDRELRQKLSQSLRLLGDSDAAAQHAMIAEKLAKIHRLCHSVYHQRNPSRLSVLQLVQLCEEVGLIEESLGWTKLGLEIAQSDADFLAARDRLLALPPTSSRRPRLREDPM